MGTKTNIVYLTIQIRSAVPLSTRLRTSGKPPSSNGALNYPPIVCGGLHDVYVLPRGSVLKSVIKAKFKFSMIQIFTDAVNLASTACI